MTPAKLAANRTNGRKSRGPRTARGKARSRWNALRKGTYCPTYFDLLDCLYVGRIPDGHKRQGPVEFEEATDPGLSSQELDHPLYASLVRSAEKISNFLWQNSNAYRQAKAEFRRQQRRRKKQILERTQNVL